MPVSLKDLATRTGVSVSTASRALANHPRISPQTRVRVQRAAAEMGYVPSAIARSLVKQETYTLGVVTTSVTDPYAAEVVKTVEDAAGAAGYQLLLVTSHGLPRREIAAVQMLRERRVDGVIVISSRGGDLYEPLMPLIEVPLVLVNSRRPGTPAHWVMGDGRQGARLATEYLLDLGHRHIGFIGGPQRGQSGRLRLRGYLEGLRSAGITPEPALVLPGEGRAEDGRHGLRRLLASRTPVTAGVCYNDLTAFGLLAEARAAGIRVPEDLSVVGFDNLPFGELTAPPLTTIEQRKEALGQWAVELVLRLRRGQPVEDVVLECTLVERDSCAPPPGGSIELH